MKAVSFPALCSVLIVAGGASSAVADNISVGSVFNLLDNRSANNAGVEAGVVDEFGALDVTPPALNGTTGDATRGTRTVQLIGLNYTALPGLFVGAVCDHGTEKTRGSWTLTFTNGSDTKSASTPKIPLSASVLPFVNNSRIDETGLTPTLSWSNTVAGVGDVIQILDFAENGNLNGGFSPSVIYTTEGDTALPNTFTSFTVPAGVLTSGDEYAVEINEVLLRHKKGTTTNSNVYDRSKAIFDFYASNATGPTSLYLPIVGTQSNGEPSYIFNMTEVAGQTYYLDPPVATGYKFSVGAGNPNFASVTLPSIAGTKGPSDNK